VLSDEPVAAVDGLIVELGATKEGFIEGEPVFVRFTIENKGTNQAIVTFGNRMLENLAIWTDADPVERKSKRLKGEGIYPAETAITLRTREKYEDILLVDKWLSLGAGKQTLHFAIKWDKDEIASSIRVVISPQSDTALEAGLNTLLRTDAATTDHVMEDLYRRGLKEACNRPRGKAALLRIQKGLSARDPASKILEEVLKNYDKGISD
jgi:hypothetical protein